MFFYRIVLFLLAPVLLIRTRISDSRAERRERLAIGRPPASKGALWIHAASNGELASAQSLIEALQNRHPLLITCNNPSGKDLVARWNLPRVTCCLAPLDFRFVLRRFFNRHDPAALVIIENEIWPNRIAAAADRGMPVIVLSARLSAPSARNWGRFPRLARAVLSRISLLSAQDQASADRFRDLGLPMKSHGPVLNLKKTIPAVKPEAKALEGLTPVFPREKTILAASTHPGEDELILGGFALALRHEPDLRLILAPRHPDRAPAIARLLSETNLHFETRSNVATPSAETQVYLADTLGEMPLWYFLASTVFVGGSLVPKGGHTPFEPAAFGCALVHGAHLDNFRDAYDQLMQNDASVLAETPNQIASAFTLSAEDRAALGSAAQVVLGDLDAKSELEALILRVEELIHRK